MNWFVPNERVKRAATERHYSPITAQDERLIKAPHVRPTHKVRRGIPLKNSTYVEFFFLYACEELAALRTCNVRHITIVRDLQLVA